jgi:hypothetical protein
MTQGGSASSLHFSRNTMIHLTVLLLVGAGGVAVGGPIVSATSTAGWAPSGITSTTCDVSDSQTQEASASTIVLCGPPFPNSVEGRASGSATLSEFSALVYAGTSNDPPFTRASASVVITDTQALMLIGGQGAATLSLLVQLYGAGPEFGGFQSSTSMRFDLLRDGILQDSATCPSDFFVYGFNCSLAVVFVDHKSVLLSVPVTFGVPFLLTERLL